MFVVCSKAPDSEVAGSKQLKAIQLGARHIEGRILVARQLVATFDRESFVKIL